MEGVFSSIHQLGALMALADGPAADKWIIILRDKYMLPLHGKRSGCEMQVRRAHTAFDVFRWSCCWFTGRSTNSRHCVTLLTCAYFDGSITSLPELYRHYAA